MSVDDGLTDEPVAVPPTVRAAGPTGVAGAESPNVITREPPAGSCSGHWGGGFPPERGHTNEPPRAAGSLDVGSVVDTPPTVVEFRTSEKPGGSVAVNEVRLTAAPEVLVKVTVAVARPPASMVAGDTATPVVTFETVTPGVTTRHWENSDVDPLKVTVVVMKAPVGALKSVLSNPTPVVAAAVSVCDPRYTWPSPKSFGAPALQAVLRKKSTRYEPVPALVSTVPSMSTPPPSSDIALETTGKFRRPFGPESPSPTSFAVTPSEPRSIPSPPFREIELPRISISFAGELGPKTAIPAPALERIVLPALPAPPIVTSRAWLPRWIPSAVLG